MLLCLERWENNNNNIMNENGSGETQGVVEEHKDSHDRSGTIILDQYQPESPAESIVATQLDEIVVALGRKEDRNQRPVVLHRRQGYSPLIAAAMRGGIHPSNARWGGAGYQANMHDMTLSSVLS